MKIKNLLELDLEDMLLHMKALGIQTIAFNGSQITLSETPPPVKEEILQSKFEDEEGKLPCGHAIWMANEAGECFEGCLGKPKEE